MASWKNKVSLFIGFSLLVLNSSVKSQNEDIIPVINCTSLTELSYKCEWNIVLGVNYTYETRSTHQIGQWSLLQMPQNHNGIASTHVIRVKWAYENQQEIRVYAIKDNSNASETATHDIKAALKPHIICKELIMNATSATLTWSTENGRRTYWEFQSQFRYGECDDETYKMCEMVELQEAIHDATRVTKTIIGLKPGRFYKFGIRSRYTRPGNGYTSWTYVVNRTDESRPSKEVQIISQEDDTLLKWNAVPKESRNGKILGYTIFVNSERYEDVDVNTTQWSLKESDDGIYNICITAYNSAGESPVNCTQVELNSTKPTELNPTETGELISRKSSKVELNSRKQEELNSTVPVKMTLGHPNEEKSSENPPQKMFKDMLIALVTTIIVSVVVVLLYCRYCKNSEIFIKWPEPKFIQINFHEVNSPVPESEIFDELCVRDSTVAISERRLSTDIDIHKLTPDGCTMVENHSYLKNLETRSTTEISLNFPEDKDELLDGPVVYHIVSKNKSDVKSDENENLRSESNVNYIGLGSVMGTESTDSSKTSRDKTAVLVKNNGDCSMPPDRSSDQEVITPCSGGGISVYPDRGYVSRCLDHGGTVSRPENVAQISDHKSSGPYLEHGSTAPSSNDGYVASSLYHLGMDSPLKQNSTPLSSDHKCMAPGPEFNVHSCSDYAMFTTTKPAKLPVIRPTENNNDYVSMTHHTINVIEQRYTPTLIVN